MGYLTSCHQSYPRLMPTICFPRRKLNLSSGILARPLLLTFIGTLALSAQPAPAVGRPIRVVVENKPDTTLLLELLRIGLPGIIGAGSAILAAWITNRNNRNTQAETHRHDEAMLDRNGRVKSRV